MQKDERYIIENKLEVLYDDHTYHQKKCDDLMAKIEKHQIRLEQLEHDFIKKFTDRDRLT